MRTLPFLLGCLLVLCCCLAVFAQTPGVNALIDASTDIAVVKVIGTCPRIAIEGARDSVKLQILQPLKGFLKKDAMVSVYYHLLWVTTDPCEIEPPKFVMGKEYIVFLTATYHGGFTITDFFLLYELTDQWLSVQPSHPQLIEMIDSKVATERRLNLYDPALSYDERSLLMMVSEGQPAEVIDITVAKPDMRQVQQNNYIIWRTWQSFARYHARAIVFNHMITEEGVGGWQYLLINDKEIYYIIDPREDRFAGNKQIRKYKVTQLHIAYRDPKKDNELQPFFGQDTAGKALVLQFQLEGQKDFCTFQ
ncbi:MAG: hypothetical protein ACYDBB_26900 [Armatimonadota bacterium]